MSSRNELKYLRTTQEKKDKLKQNLRRVLYIGICLVVLYLIFLGDNGLIAVGKYYRIKEEAKENLAAKQVESDSLKAEIQRLESDTTYMEKIAREEYGLTKDNEKILRFREQDERKVDKKD